MPFADIFTIAFWTGWPTAQYVVLAVAAALLLLVFRAFTKWEWVANIIKPELGEARQVIGGVSAVAAILLVLMTPLATMIPFIGLDAPISLAAPVAEVEVPAVPTVPGVPTALVVAPVGAAVVPIDSFKVQIKELYSNSYTATGGYLEVYEADVDPSDPTANYLMRVTISSGVGSDTNGLVSVDTAYRVVWNGDGTWYDKDYGVISFSSTAYNAETGKFTFRDSIGVGKIATIDDMLDETDTGGDIFNGQSTNAVTTELYGQTDAIIYNESAGDGSFYLKPTISISGGNLEAHDIVYCYQWDSSNPVEGNELSALTYQLESGTSLGFPSNLLPFWSSESCISLYDGEPVPGGTSSKVRFTYTITEANCEDGTDVWKEHLDDLGDINGKSILLSTGATGDSIQFTTGP